MEKLWAKDTEGVASASQSIKMPLFRDPLVGQWCRTEILSSSGQPGWRDVPTAFPVNTETCYKSHSSAYASWLLITSPMVGWCYFQPCSVNNYPSSTEIFFFQGTNLPLPLCWPTLPLTIFSALILKPGGLGTLWTGTQSVFLWDEVETKLQSSSCCSRMFVSFGA